MLAERTSALLERERANLAERTPESRRLFERARRVLPGGVTSSFQAREPWPVYLARGEGARVWDVDGHEYVDFHNGFSAMVQGHAHPAIGAALAARSPQGTHFAAPGEDAVLVAEELARRWALPQWRFTNSGSEATMGAIRLARALSGREPVLRIAGSYHGHNDTMMAGRSAGIPAAVAGQVHDVEFNDAAALERADRRPRAGLRGHGGRDDRHRGGAPRARLPRGRARHHPRERRADRARRGQDRAHDRRRRRGRALRARARPRDASQGARGRPAQRGDRDERRGGRGW